MPRPTTLYVRADHRVMQGSLSRHSTAEAADRYWFESRQPLMSLVYLAPLLAAYEAGVVWLGGPLPEAVRNRADWWMRSGLSSAGLQHAVALPALVAAVLLAWHQWGRFPWRVRISTFGGMAAESLLFALVLIVVGQLQAALFLGRLPTAAISLDRQTAALAVSYLGAGLYEEVLFRLCLLPAVFGLLRLVRMPWRWAAVLAVLTTGLAFAVAHHIESPDAAIPPALFAFRALAGVFFAGLFYCRGFGITVGCHAAYDLIVGVLLAERLSLDVGGTL